jgi:hypothetical protein
MGRIAAEFGRDVTNPRDLSGLGVEMQWMTGDEVLDEATRCEPGISAAGVSPLPVAGRLLPVSCSHPPGITGYTPISPSSIVPDPSTSR